ncbi:hypothetical protein [Cupriavidus pampae]|uniref:Stability/partitioning determinant n=1 Tax=Cupriavidus pampae TaxID=659251 RepID=A0ABN7ZLA8_9BURK|nr:hypothetical protein [Cupriavidus pampae]CAG9185993.1 hypothetical protein LMG32289_06198 [Cupriavidus pampae]
MTRANPLDLSVEDFSPRTRDDKPRVDRETISQVAKDNGFHSRDAAKVEAAAAAGTPRRHRRFTTGRNQQINIKATADTIARFNKLADELGLPAGALLERAVQILEEKAKR